MTHPLIILSEEILATDLILRDLEAAVSALYGLSLTSEGLQQILDDGGVVAESALALNLVFSRMKQAESDTLVRAMTAAE
jgi:hypothetical protein